MSACRIYDCAATSPHWSNYSMDKVYWNIIPFLLNNLSKFLQVSWLNWPLPYSFIEHFPQVPHLRLVSRQCWPRRQRYNVLVKEIHVGASDMGTGIVLLKDKICPGCVLMYGRTTGRRTSSLYRCAFRLPFMTTRSSFPLKWMPSQTITPPLR